MILTACCRSARNKKRWGAGTLPVRAAIKVAWAARMVRWAQAANAAGSGSAAGRPAIMARPATPNPSLSTLPRLMLASSSTFCKRLMARVRSLSKLVWGANRCRGSP
jgi:hypothetical protein